LSRISSPGFDPSKQRCDVPCAHHGDMLPYNCSIVASPLLYTLPLSIPAALAGLGYTFLAPTSRLWGPVVSHGDMAGPPRCALTFDDGPTPGSTSQILDLLAELEVKAAFFVIGKNAAQSPGLVQRMHGEGHVVSNHTYDHWHYAGLRSVPYWTEQITRTDDLIESLIGHRPVFFRPPLGLRTWHTTRAVRAQQHTLITWTHRAKDGIRPTVERILTRLVPPTKGGDILLLHDGVEPNVKRNPQATVDAIRPLVKGLREKGIEPVRLDSFIGLKPYQTKTK
jgi:peptidoglycan-N-acetylglucosamine deacetylase